MSDLNSTPSANRVHIAFFGKRNSGKSSLVNVLANQEVSIVSDVLGTTTDPVSKAVEIFPIGPCTLIDTAGFDDEGELGKLRIEKTLNIFNKTDVAIMVIESDEKDFELYNEWIEKIKKRKIPLLCVINKIDLENDTKQIEDVIKQNSVEFVKVSTLEKINIYL